MRTFGRVVLYITGGFGCFWGLIFILVGLVSMNTDPEAFYACTGLGVVVLAIFGIVPIIVSNVIGKKAREAQQAQADQKVRIENELKEAARMEKENRFWTCSHCGANTKGLFCEYCDSPFEE